MSTRLPSARTWTRGRDVSLAAAFALILLWYDSSALHLSVHAYLADTWMHHGAFGVVVRVGGVLALLVAQAGLLWAPLGASWPWRIAAWLAFASATAIEYGYVHVTGQVTSGYDVTVAFEQLALWPSIIPHALVWRAALPAVGYALVLLWRRAPASGGGRRQLAACVFTLAVHATYIVTAYLQPGRTGAVPVSLPPASAAELFARSIVLYGWRGLEGWLPSATRARVAFHAPDDPTTHVVLIIDESVRGDHLSLNGYARETSPWLEELRRTGRLTNWGIASSAASMSYTSVGSLLTGVNHLPDRGRRMLAQPTIVQFAKAMRYETHVIDGEANALRFPLTDDDRSFIDDWTRQVDLGDDVETDVRIAQRIRGLLARSRGQFIVALKRGNHYPYRLNYPRTAAVWGEGADAGPGLVDAYDNAIRYNLDRFFHALLDADGGLPRTVVLYTSDHADSLTDEWRSFHWGTFAVPLLMLGDARPAVDDGYRAAHQNIFATLLDLMQFPERDRPSEYGRSLLTARAADVDERAVFAGSPFGEDEYTTADFDAMKK